MHSFPYIRKLGALKVESQKQLFMSIPAFRFQEAFGFWIYEKLAVKSSTEAKTNTA
jgi:hypothetical protein